MASRALLPLAVAAGLTAAGASLADDIAPGLWEITMAPRLPGGAASPLSLTQCLTAGDAKDPGGVVGSLAVPGAATGCSYTDKSYSGNTFRFAMDCSAAYGITARGSVTFAADRFSGNITATGSLPSGQTLEIENEVSARRVGGC